MSYARSSAPTRFLRVCPLRARDEARALAEGAAREAVEVDARDIDAKRAATFEFARAEDATAALELLRGRTRASVFGEDVADGETALGCGYSARASDSRAPERAPTKAKRRFERGAFVEGLTLIENFVTVDEERALVTLAATSGDETRLARRRVKHFGYAFDYGTRDANSKAGDEIPALAMEVLRRLPRETPGYEGAMRCDQVTVNEYPRGVGLAPHVDTHSAFGDTILSLSLLGGTVMEFRTSGEAHRAIYLPPRSLLVMHGESRYRWQHYIPHRKFDTLEGEATPTPRDDVRLSYTFRERRSGPCECAFPLQCDSRDGAQSKCSKRKTGKTQAFAELVGVGR